MQRRTVLRLLSVTALTCAAAFADARTAQAQANPGIANYGWGQIVATPHFPIVGETATISVSIRNNGTAPATNVQVKLSFNDWGVTFFGWQQLGTTQTIAVIPPGESAIASVTHVFANRAHTCVEALVLSSDGGNTDPNDDRGQINLEVIDTGDNFGYDVPVVNNGEGPLNAAVNGLLFHEEQGAPGGQRVEVFPPEVNLAPGEMALVHVALDLRELPPGPLPMMLMIEAHDLADPNARNNVVFQIRKTTAYQLKRDALAELQSLHGDMPTVALKNRVAVAIGHVQKSMELRFWKPGDENRLARSNSAASVFAQEAAAAHILEGLLNDEIDLDDKVRIDTVIRGLTDADRILAETAIADAAGHPAATVIRQQGDESRQEGEYVDAIRTYSKAWIRSLRP